LLLLAFKAIFASVLKNSATRILLTFILLLCFTTGQVIVFTHSHVANFSKTQSKHQASTNADENCKICQLNHDAIALLNIDLPNAIIYGTAYKQVLQGDLSYQSISLVLAATRGPPVV